MRKVALSCVAFATLAVTAGGADLFTGTWVENRDKRKYDDRPTPISYEPYKDGIRYSSGAGPVYEGAFDGKPYPMLNGAPASDRVTLKKIDGNTYEATVTRGKRKLWSETVAVSEGGKRLTRRVTSWNDEGKETTNVFVHTRHGDAAEGMPHYGKWIWNRDEMKWSGDPQTVTITSSPNGWKYRFTGYKADHSVKFDGSETPVPETDGTTVSGKRIDDRTVELTFKRDGKVQSVIRFSPSEDGKELMLKSTAHLANGETRGGAMLYTRK
jgi:hypothetical protein